MIGVLSHYRAKTGAVCVETREESRLLRELISELPEEAHICTCAAPSGQLRDARTGRNEQTTGLIPAYGWLASAPGNVLVVYDWHMLANAPGHWRALIDALPNLRSPKGAEGSDPGSLVIFVAPSWDFQPINPLRGLLPVLSYAPPDRETLRATLTSLHPLNGDAEAVIDSVCGLSADTAEQTAAEVLVACQGRYDVDRLRAARRRALRDAGLEIWPATPQLGGLSGFQGFVTSEVVPWIRDAQLSVRRILCAGVPGVGKSFCARWLAGQLQCECARLSIPALKAGIVGASETNLRRALGVIDALAKDAPVVVVVDEIDTIARDGLDGGTSSGMFSELLTWLQESPSQAIVLATLNRLDKLDAALESRFQARFFYDLPGEMERDAVAGIHFARLGCEGTHPVAAHTEGYSSREIAEHVCPSVARLSGRKPDEDTIRRVCAEYTPASQTQGEQLKLMRRAAASLRRANDPESGAATKIARQFKFN